MKGVREKDFIRLKCCHCGTDTLLFGLCDGMAHALPEGWLVLRDPLKRVETVFVCSRQCAGKAYEFLRSGRYRAEPAQA